MESAVAGQNAGDLVGSFSVSDVLQVAGNEKDEA